MNYYYYNIKCPLFKLDIVSQIIMIIINESILKMIEKEKVTNTNNNIIYHLFNQLYN